MKQTLPFGETENLFLEISRDDPHAFRKIFEIYSHRLIRFAINYVKSKEQAEEVVSDVFVNIWNNRKKLGNIQNANAYLLTATKNQSLTYIEKYNKNTLCSLDSLLEKNAIENFTPQTGMEANELKQLILDLVEQLPLSSKTAFKLIKEEKMKYKDVAEIMGVSIGTVEVQVLRAVKKIRSGLVGYFQQELTTTKAKKSKKVPLNHFVSCFLIFFIFF